MILFSCINLIVSVVMVYATVNNTKMYDSINSSQKDGLGCHPNHYSENWENWKIAKLACITKDYYAAEHPDTKILTPVLAGDWNTSVIDINEKKKSLEIYLQMELIWEDPRIRAHFLDYNEKHKLPLIRKDAPTYMWTPIFLSEVDNVKQVKYLYDPIMLSWIYLLSSNHDYVVNSSVFSKNTTLISAWMEWQVIIPCNFDFSNYPLDSQKCSLRMSLYDVNTTLRDLYAEYYEAEKIIEMNGFEIIKKLVDPVYGVFGPSMLYSDFGFDFEIRRITWPYLMQYYLPTFAIVIVASFSFVVPISAAPGRIGLVVTQFLTLTNLFIHQKVKRQLIKR